MPSADAYASVTLLCLVCIVQVWWQFNVARMAILYANGRSQEICTNCNTIADSGWPEIVITPRQKYNIAAGSLTGVALITNEVLS
jgi:hypothetical protein